MGVVNFFTTLFTCKVLDVDKPKEQRRLPTWTDGNFQYNWIGILIIGVPPLMVALGALLQVKLQLSTLIIAIVYALVTGCVGVTAGYHRLYSHRAYTAGPFMMKLTAFFGAGAFQGSIKWWARLHRIHHKYTDADKDPYDARRGFWFSHIGWFVMRMDYDLLGTVDTSDLDAHPVVKFQRDNFAILAVLSGVILPWVTCGLLGDDWVGGFFYGAFVKMCIIHQGTFFINSLCHTNWFRATQNYSDEATPHDSVVFALFTFGEGYHNYHHAFAQDYRNGSQWYHFDPTKWYVYICMKLNFCWNLVRVPQSVIQRAYRDTCNRRNNITAEGKQAQQELLGDTFPTVSDVMTEEEMVRLVKEEGRRLLICEDYVLDLDRPIALEASTTHEANLIFWYDAHPGGKAVLDMFIGKDATEAMAGGVYKHTHGARCTIPELRIAHLKRKI